MAVFLKVKKIGLLLNSTLWIYRNKRLSFFIVCAIKFYVNVINVCFVYYRFFLLKKWTKFRINCFLFDSERDSGIIFNRRPPVKMADFQSEVTFISVFDGIRFIFEAPFIIQLCF
jgi:hypothetical protein